MQEKFFDNADSFAIAFDDEWKKLDIENKDEKIKKILKILSQHPYVISNPDRVKEIVNFRLRYLKIFQRIVFDPCRQIWDSGCVFMKQYSFC